MKRLSVLRSFRSGLRRRDRRRTHAAEALEDRALLTPGVTFDFEIIASDLHPDFRLFDSPNSDDAPFTIIRYGEITMSSLVDLPNIDAVVNSPSDLVVEFGSDDPNNPEEVAVLTGFFKGALPNTPGAQQYRTQDGLDSDFVLTNAGSPVASGFVETVDGDVAPPDGPGGDPQVTSDNVRIRFTQMEGNDPTIFDEIMRLTNGSGTMVLSLDTFGWTGAATGFGDSQVFVGVGNGDIGEGSVLAADDLPLEFTEGPGPRKILPLTRTDPAGRTRLISFTQPDKGTVTDNGDGTVDFTPDAGSSGTTTFDYQIGRASLERTASDAETKDEYGRSVSIHDTTAVVGAPFEDAGGEDSGAVYVYERDNDTEWVEVAKLTASDAAAKDRFGYSVHVSGDIIIVGARSDDDMGTNSGSVYVFRKTGGVWTELKKLNDPTGKAKDQFGHSVAMDGETVVVGARLDDGKGTNSGSAFVFERNLGGADNFGFVKRIKASDAAKGDQFGAAVSITENVIMVGAYKSDSDTSAARDVGAAYVYGRDVGGTGNWGEVQKLAGSGQANDWFGYSVAITETHAVVGKPIRNNRQRIGTASIRGKDTGGVDTWGEIKSVSAPNSSPADQFGIAVGMVDDNVLVGARGDDNAGNGTGAAYHFQQDFGGPNSYDLLATYSGERNGDALGSTVAVSDDMFLIGAPKRDNDGARSGSAYFEGSTTLTATVTVEILGSPLLADSAGPGATALNTADLNRAAMVAREQWIAAGISADQIALLDEAELRIDDLAERRLGEAYRGLIIIDVDAAGFGWSADTVAEGGRMDLTTVLAHEYGHILGRRDVYDATASNSLMYGFLSAGQQRHVDPTVDVVFQSLVEEDELNLF